MGDVCATPQAFSSADCDRGLGHRSGPARVIGSTSLQPDNPKATSGAIPLLHMRSDADAFDTWRSSTTWIASAKNTWGTRPLSSVYANRLVFDVAQTDEALRSFSDERQDICFRR
jgi:hypothetical protein